MRPRPGTLFDAQRAKREAAAATAPVAREGARDRYVLVHCAVCLKTHSVEAGEKPCAEGAWTLQGAPWPPAGGEVPWSCASCGSQTWAEVDGVRWCRECGHGRLLADVAAAATAGKVSRG